MSAPALKTPTRLKVLAAVREDLVSARAFQVTGQTARALLALKAAGPEGCTALEVSSWALRFAAYTHALIRDHGLVIETRREEHPGGWHGRHILHSPVEILAVEGGAE